MQRFDVYFKLHAGLSQALFTADERFWADGFRLIHEALEGRDSLPVRGGELADAVGRVLERRPPGGQLTPEDRTLLADLCLELLAIAYDEDRHVHEPLARLFEDETDDDFVSRIASKLPTWPRELLVEWLHRHSPAVTYQWLKFERFSFALEEWELDRIPGVEVMVGGMKDWAYILDRAPTTEDWVAQYIREHGTWNTPIVLLSNPDALHGHDLNAPWHLLEGHHRLAYLNGLRRAGSPLAPKHRLYIATVAPPDSSLQR